MGLMGKPKPAIILNKFFKPYDTWASVHKQKKHVRTKKVQDLRQPVMSMTSDPVDSESHTPSLLQTKTAQLEMDNKDLLNTLVRKISFEEIFNKVIMQ